VREPRIVLVGMMGSGKSAVGRALAERTGWPFVDNDDLVEQATGRTARELLARAGEEAMEAESAALGAALELDPPVIVATAAGTILGADDRSRLAGSGLVAWLRAPADVLAARSKAGDHRPWQEGDAAGWFRREVTRRDPLYAMVADVEIDTSFVSPATAAETILSAATIRP
jgi:shikimate kinase